jgi:hypothetical protein
MTGKDRRAGTAGAVTEDMAEQPQTAQAETSREKDRTDRAAEARRQRTGRMETKSTAGMKTAGAEMTADWICLHS